MSKLTPLQKGHLRRAWRKGYLLVKGNDSRKLRDAYKDYCTRKGKPALVVRVSRKLWCPVGPAEKISSRRSGRLALVSYDFWDTGVRLSNSGISKVGDLALREVPCLKWEFPDVWIPWDECVNVGSFWGCFYCRTEVLEEVLRSLGEIFQDRGCLWSDEI